MVGAFSQIGDLRVVFGAPSLKPNIPLATLSWIGLPPTPRPAPALPLPGLSLVPGPGQAVPFGPEAPWGPPRPASSPARGPSVATCGRLTRQALPVLLSLPGSAGRYL